jgi:hypothetical protein
MRASVAKCSILLDEKVADLKGAKSALAVYRRQYDRVLSAIAQFKHRNIRLERNETRCHPLEAITESEISHWRGVLAHYETLKEKLTRIPQAFRRATLG